MKVMFNLWPGERITIKEEWVWWKNRNPFFVTYLPQTFLLRFLYDPECFTPNSLRWHFVFKIMPEFKHPSFYYKLKNSNILTFFLRHIICNYVVILSCSKSTRISTKHTIDVRAQVRKKGGPGCPSGYDTGLTNLTSLVRFPSPLHFSLFYVILIRFQSGSEPTVIWRSRYNNSKMVLKYREVGVCCRTGYRSMGPLCGPRLGQNAFLSLNNNSSRLEKSTSGIWIGESYCIIINNIWK